MTSNSSNSQDPLYSVLSYAKDDLGIVSGELRLKADESREDLSQESLVSIKQEQFSQEIPPLTDLDHVHAFLNYSLPPFQPDRKHTSSTATRVPAFFDRHLDERLRLDHIARLPSLASDIAAAVDNALQDYLCHHELPSTAKILIKEQWNTFPDDTILDDALNESAHSKVTNEKDIEETYKIALAQHCLVVASTLAFRFPVWSKGYLRWVTQDETGGKHAMPDGSLLIDPDANVVELDVPLFPNEYRTMTEQFPALGIWEFKSLTVDTLELFENILQCATTSDRFPWVGCQAGELCIVEHPQVGSDEPKKEWCRLGPDAMRGTDSDHRTEPLPLSEDHQKTGRNTNTTVVYVIQQTWAEMVKHDTTYGVFDAGNFMLILKRNRMKRILHINDIIKIEEPGQAKLVVGLIITMLHDAMVRSTSLSRSIPATWTNINPYSNKGDALSPEAMLQEVLTRSWLTLSLKKGDIAPSFYPNKPYFRVVSQPVFPNHGQSATSSQAPHFRLVLEEALHACEASLKVSGITFPGIPGRISPRLFVKTANHPDILERLETEHRVYLALEAANVASAPDVIGLFKYANVEGNKRAKLGSSCLVLEYVGRQKIAEVKDKRGRIPKVLEDACLDGLKEIHTAGYCHGDISLDNIIVRSNDCQRDSRSPISFVSFARAFEALESYQKNDELQKLRKLLKSGLTRTHTSQFDESSDMNPPVTKRRVLEAETMHSLGGTSHNGQE